MPEPELVEPDYHCQIAHDHDDDCEWEPKWWTCRYYQTVERDDVKTESCSFGCWEEPNCITGGPWPEAGEGSLYRLVTEENPDGS